MDNAPVINEPTNSLLGNNDATKFLLTTSETAILPKPRKKLKPFYARTRGARRGRMEKIEDLLHPLIKAGLVKVIRRKFAPPLIKWSSRPQPQAAAA